MELPPDMWEPPVDLFEPSPAPSAPVSGTAQRPAAQRHVAPDPTAGGASPAGNPVTSATQPKPTPPTATSAATVAAPATESKRILRPIKTWTEVVDRVRDTSRMAASFLVSAKAYTTEDGRVVVKLDSDFVRSMVSREGAPEALRAALSVCLQRKLDSADILYEVEAETKSDGSLIDLIIEAAEE